MLAADEQAVLSGGEIQLTPDNINQYVSSGLSDGTYILSQNITVASGSLTFGGTATLDLNGHTLTFTAPAETQVPTKNGDTSYFLNAGIVVSGDLMLIDSSESHSGKLDVPGMGNIGVLVAPIAKFTMTGGTITNSTPGDNHGIGLAVFGATASMTGGKITGEKNFGVWAAASSKTPSSFTMDDDAVISDCGTDDNSRQTTGGGVLIAGNCTLTIKGGTITNCAAYHGGGVYFGGDTFTMSGGSITNCKAENGGGVYMQGRTFNLSGGTISGCESNGGGGIYTYAPDATIIMSNGSITGCSARNGGGVYLESSSSTFTMDGGSITNCKATEEGMGYGGGVLLTNGRFTMNGGEISGCTANEGSSILAYGLSTASDVTLNDGTVAGSIVLSYKLNSGTYRMEGLGTPTDPYQIENGNQLLVFQSIVNGTNGQTINPAACAEVTKNLEMNNITGFSPIGTQEHPYTGTFVGNYEHKGGTDHPANIHDLKIDSSSGAVGLFGYVEGATIQNIKLWDSSITTTERYVGGIVGYAKGTTKIENCSTSTMMKISGKGSVGGIVGGADDTTEITNCTNEANPSGNSNIGGIVGYTNGSITINNCTNKAFVTGVTDVGGIAGYMQPGVTITNCTNEGNIEITGSGTKKGGGGIVGYSNTATITNCANHGHITATNQNSSIGGIAGYTSGTVTISSCYNTGEIEGNRLPNNLVSVGGIAGYVGDYSNFMDCYNVGKIHKGWSIGGIAGHGCGSFTNCYNTGEVTDFNYYSGGLIGEYAFLRMANNYYLDTSASTGIFNASNWPGADPRTAAEFADGSVLTALIAGRADGQHPWNGSCQYLNVTGKTQPVFQTQGDSHIHTGGTWLHDGTSHWKVCDCNAVFDKAAHTAADDGDCTTPVICEVCGETVTAANTAHTWGAWTSNGNSTHTRRCTVPGCTAGVETEACVDANRDYSCDRCGAALPRPAPTTEPAATATPTPAATAAPTATAAPISSSANCAAHTDTVQTVTPTAQPQQTPQPTATAQPVIPATGDADAPALWTALFFLSGAAFLTLTAARKRRNR